MVLSAQVGSIRVYAGHEVQSRNHQVSACAWKFTSSHHRQWHDARGYNTILVHCHDIWKHITLTASHECCIQIGCDACLCCSTDIECYEMLYVYIACDEKPSGTESLEDKHVRHFIKLTYLFSTIMVPLLVPSHTCGCMDKRWFARKTGPHLPLKPACDKARNIIVRGQIIV